MSTLDACIFDVSDNGIIFVPDIPKPKTRCDVYKHIDPNAIHTCANLISAIARYTPLIRHFQQLGQQYLDQHTGVDAFLHSLQEPIDQHIHRQSMILKQLRQNPEDGWKDWIEYSGDAAIENFLQIVRQWLACDIDWSESEHFDGIWDGQEAAYRYFYMLPAKVLKALGVEIDYAGSHGATVNAARMTKTRNEVNKIAEMLELECRFRSEHYKRLMELIHG